MKTYLCLLLLCMACERSTPAPSGRADLSFEVIDELWQAEGAVIIGLSTVGAQDHLTISGRDETFQGQISSFTLVMSVDGSLKTGTYALKDHDGSAALTKVDGKTYMASSARPLSLKIDDIQGSGNSRKVRGTFSGTLTGPTPGDLVKILNGKFNAQ